ncbi:MAG TPA: hypothetical protein VFU86_08390, partial [Terriglobales bacterium]|nr:hypothetical protein [Terriglobales bacterium]
QPEQKHRKGDPSRRGRAPKSEYHDDPQRGCLHEVPEDEVAGEANADHECKDNDQGTVRE